MNFVNDEIKVVPLPPKLTPKQERFVDTTVEIIWTLSWVGLFVLGLIALSQKRFKQ
jgi:hypothetical protein